MTEKRKFPKFSCEIFENNHIDDAFAIMQKLEERNRRVNRIFDTEDDDDTEVEVNDKSYGLHLISCRDSLPRSCSDKENNEKPDDQQAGSKSFQNVRLLSPVDLVIMENEQIIDTQIKEPKVIVKPNRRNSSLRRSLFQQQHKVAGNELICSTPVTNHRICRKESFINSGTEFINSLSPIRRNAEQPANSELNGIEEIAQSKSVQSLKEPEVAIPVGNLAGLENDLRQQYQIDAEKTPTRKSRPKSRVSEHRAPSSSKVKKVKSTRSEPTIGKTLYSHFQSMEVSRDVISNDQDSQIIKPFCVTDANSFQIVETPLPKRHQNTAHYGSALNREFQPCEADSEMTSDNDSESKSTEKSNETPTTAPQNHQRSGSQKQRNVRTSHHLPMASNEDEMNKNSSQRHSSRLEKRKGNAPPLTVPSKKSSDVSERNEIANESETSEKTPSPKVTNKKQKIIAQEHLPEEIEIEVPDTRHQKKNRESKNEKNINEKENSQSESDQLTEEAEIEVQETRHQKKKLANKNKTKIVQEKEPESESDQSDVSDNEVQETKSPKKTPLKKGSKLPKKRANKKSVTVEESRESETGTETCKDSPETVIFKKPFEKNAKSRREIISGSPSLDAKVPHSLVVSLSNLRKTISDTSVAVQEPTQSRRFSIPKRPRTNKKASPVIPAHLKLAKRKTGGRQKKRTLYSQSSFIEDEEPPTQSSQDEPMEIAEKSIAASENSRDIRNTVSEIRKSLDRASTTSSDFDAELPPQSPAKEKSKNSKAAKNKKNEKQTKKAAVKRLRSQSSSDTESLHKQQKKKTRRALANSESENEQVDNECDEGFGSDNNDNRMNIRYDPYERGCQRPGLRVRKYPTAWWRHDTESQNYGLVYGHFTAKLYIEEKKVKKLLNKHHVKPMRAIGNVMSPQRFDPKNVLRKVEEITRFKRAGSATSTRSKPTAPEKKKPALSTIQQSDNEDNNSGASAPKKKKPALSTIQQSDNEDNHSGASDAISTCTFKTASSRSETIKKVFDSYSADNGPHSKCLITQSYDLQQINKLEWTACGKNILFHQFIDYKNDGFIKFLPGAIKGKAKTKRSFLKFVLLSGKIDFCINNEEQTLEHLGFISIKPGNTYSAQNPYDEPAILSFVRVESTETSTSSSYTSN